MFRSALRGSATVLFVFAAFAISYGRGPAPAIAHVPVLEPYAASTATSVLSMMTDSRRVEPPDESRAIYGTLVSRESGDGYWFSADQTIETTVEVLVPASVAEEEWAAVRFVVTDVEARDIWPAAPVSEQAFFEPFSLQRFSVVARATYRFEEGHSYVLSVTPAQRVLPPGRVVPYVIAFSGSERFALRDVLSSAVDVPRIWFGLYGQWAPRWGMIGGALLFVVALATTAVLLRRRRRSRA